MKKILSLLFLISTFTIVGCHDKAASHLDEILSIVASLDLDDQRSFFDSAGIGDGDTGDFSVENYHPTSGNNRLVLKKTSTDGDHEYFGLDMTGYNDVLKDLDGLSDVDKQTALSDFVSAGYVDDLDKFGVGKDLTFRERGNGNIFSQTTSTSKDLESLGAKIEMRNAEDFGEKLVADYGLSEQRAQKVARTINAYQRITSKRALTEREQNAYTQELLGVNYQTAKKAIMHGANLDQLMEDAAEKNGTSPEQVSAIIRDMIL